MKNTYALLALAEAVAEENDSYTWFCQHFSSYRMYHGIHIAIERTMEALDLWDQYEARAIAAGLMQAAEA